MSLGQAKRKLTRIGKTAIQFRITSTFEFIELECKGTWRPEKLRVIWLRNHRKVKSNDTTWTIREDFGPNGAKGRAIFSPVLSVSLVVTLYRDANTTTTEFEEKEYKYHVESEGSGGKKILATFNCNVADFVGIPSTKQALDLNFKCVSKKVSHVRLGITLESMFMKEGGAQDDDMQSTFSAISSGMESVIFYDDDDEEEKVVELDVNGTGTLGGNRLRLNTLKEESENDLEDTQRSVILGTGVHLKLDAIPQDAPSKPPRSFASSEVLLDSQSTEADLTDLSSSFSTGQPNIVDSSVSTSLPHQVDVTDDEKNKGKVTESRESGEGKVNLEYKTVKEIVGATELGVVMYEEPLRTETLKVVKSPESESEQKSVASISPAGMENKMEETEIALALAASKTPDAEQAEIIEATKKEGSEISMTEELENFKPGKSQGDKMDRSELDEQLKDHSKSVSTEASSRNTEPTLNYVQEAEPTSSVSKGPSFLPEDVKLEPAQDEVNADQQEVGVADLESVIDNTASTTAVSSFDHATSSLTSQQRQVIESNETYVSPPNPYLEDEGLEMEIEAEPKNPCLIEMWIDSSVVLVDCFEGVVNHDKLNTVDIIGLYFSAGWCPPCRKFLPKLVKFYHHLKQHGKSFELIYVSSDYSKQDMVKYMKEQQMPWLGVEYGEESSEILRKKFKVVAVPMLKILGIKGNLIEESAKRPIEGASSGSAILKLYNKWYNMLEEERASTTALSNTDSKKTLFGKVKASIQGKEKGTEQDSLVALGTKVGSPVASSVRLSLDTHTRTKVKSAKADDVTQELLDEKEDRIQHLEEVNRTLKQTNDDHMEEIEELRQKLALLSSELDQIKSTSKTLQDESKELIANLNMRGWLYKRGLRGPTANIWRRRYFRLDQGSNLYYYKNSSEGNPQGYIDLDKVLNVQEVISAQQDKNHATFLVQCDGRTFQLQAHDETSMRRWMEAISYITNWRKKTVPKNMGAHP